MLGVVFPLNIRFYQMTIRDLKNEYKVAQEPVLVQQYLCKQVKFPAQLSVLLCRMSNECLVISDLVHCRPIMWPEGRRKNTKSLNSYSYCCGLISMGIFGN